MADLHEGMRIDVVKDGPYIVSGGVPLLRAKIVVDAEGDSVSYEETHRYPLQDKYALCRCGASDNKPYCDGSHVRVGFTSRMIAPNEFFMDEAQAIEGDGIRLLDATRLCIGARFCDRAGGAWGLTEHSDNEVAKQVAVDEAKLCPSGRLVMIDTGTGQPIEPDFEPSIVLLEDPANNASSALWVRGGIPVFDEKGNPYEVRNRVTLCRCGASRDMTFCDGSHYRVRFDDGYANE